ncbi:hypothetical protein L9F63_007022, partial [Diploptera punctata]
TAVYEVADDLAELPGRPVCLHASDINSSNSSSFLTFFLGGQFLRKLIHILNNLTLPF